jgi:hypothetical protein
VIGWSARAASSRASGAGPSRVREHVDVVARAHIAEHGGRVALHG